MGLGARFYIFEGNGDIRQIPFNIYEDMVKGRTDRSFPEYSNKRMKGALVFLDLENRKPMKIRNIEYSWVVFDSDGRIDQQSISEENNMAGPMLGSIIKSVESDDIYDNLRPDLTRKQYEDKFKWKPNLSEDEKLITAIFP